VTYIPSAISRRSLLKTASFMAGAALAPAALAPRAFGQASHGDDPFTLGVASGEPLADGVVLWTRLAPRPLEADGGMPARSVPVGWEVAEDPGFRRIAAKGRVLAGPAAGHAVHVEVSGLRPGREYWYRFTLAQGSSPVGRTCTAPAPGSDVDLLRVGFGSCQKYESGFYGAYADLVAYRPDVADAVRLHQNPEPMDVAGYRVRYATYKSDLQLQAAHAVAPWMVIWDDHEVSNDYGGDRAEIAMDPAVFLRRRAAAYQAYYEHMPLRRRAQPVGPDMLLYRKLDWGRLAQFQFLDDRQYRSPRACGPAPAEAGKLIPDCDERRSAERSMLGDAQERWLLDTLGDSTARWNLLTQQTLFAPMEARDPARPGESAWSSDGWDGSPATRDRIATRWRDARVSNPMVLGGDIHTFAAADVRSKPGGDVVAPAFVGGSITSFGGSAAKSQAIRAINPDIAFHNGEVRGYGRVDIRRDRSVVTFRGLADARRQDSSSSDLAVYAIESGRPSVQSA
jgi:alkaline phosphatase D